MKQRKQEIEKQNAIYKMINKISFLLYWLIMITTIICESIEEKGVSVALLVTQIIVYIPLTISMCFKKSIPGVLIGLVYSIFNMLFGGISLLSSIISDKSNVMNLLTSISLLVNSIFMFNLSLCALRKKQKPANILLYILAPIYIVLNIISFIMFDEKNLLLDGLSLLTTILLGIIVPVFYKTVEDEEIIIFK